MIQILKFRICRKGMDSVRALDLNDIFDDVGAINGLLLKL